MRRRPTVTIGLTGSIGMGKSTAGALLRRLRIPVHEADREVHALLGAGGAAVEAVAAAFPGVVRNGAVDRARLGAMVFDDPAALARLESIIHPLVRTGEERFLARAAARRQALVALDIPLLFETDSAARVDAAVVLSAPSFVQAARVLGRAGMTVERLSAIRARQMPDAAKRRLADVVVPTALGRRLTLCRLARVARTMRDPRRRAAIGRAKRRARNA
ncbi:MAG: dephospho-CoA kinase [Alphaproteobacteria bacterium]